MRGTDRPKDPSRGVRLGIPGRTHAITLAGALVLIGCGGPGTTGLPAVTAGPPAASDGAGATVAPAPTDGAAPATGAPATSGQGGSSGEAVATLTLRGGFEDAFTDLEGDNVSPAATILAAVWVEARDNLAESYADIATVTLTGPVAAGSHATSASGLVLAFNVSRTDAAGNDLFFHSWTSSAGECTVTMETGAAISGSFTCTGIKSADGLTVDAEGTYRT